MSKIKCKVYITYTGSQPLSLIEQKMESNAKYEHEPLSQVNSGADKQMLLEGINRDGLAVGPKGYVMYQASDNSQFKITFCSYATGKSSKSDNQITCTGNPTAWNYQRDSYDEDGREVKVYYSISQR